MATIAKAPIAVSDPSTTLQSDEYRIRTVDLTGKVAPPQLKSQKQIFFEYVSALDEKKYEGAITFRRLPIPDVQKCESEKERRNYGIDPRSEIAVYNERVVDLVYQVTGEAPKWLRYALGLETPPPGEEVYDTDVLLLLWKELNTFNSTFRRPL